MKLLLFLITVSCAFAEPDRGVLSARISDVCPVDGVLVPDTNPAMKASWVIRFKAAATPAQRSAAQSVITNWTSDDWDGTAAQRRRKKLLRIIELHKDRMALTTERDYWQAQGDAARVGVIQSLIDSAQAEIDSLRPQS